MAWLAKDDPAVAAELPAGWRTLLTEYVAEPFRNLGASGAIRSRASASATTPIGTLMKKIHDQLRPSVSAPPASGPIATAIPTVEPHTAIAVPRSGPRNSCAMSARPVANIAAPPKPCTARATSSIVGVVARPQAREAKENTVTPTAKTRLRPNRSARLPAVSSVAANVRA